MKKKRILFFAEAVTLAHIARCISLANQLDSTDNYIIALAADSRYDKIIGKLPYLRLPLYSISSKFFVKNLTRGSVLYSVNTLSTYVEEDLNIIKDFKPDFIIGDFRLSLAISSRLAGVKYATITNAYWSPYANISYTVPDIILTKILGVRIAQLLFDWAKYTVFIIHSLAFNKTCKKFGIPCLKYDMREVYTHADYTLYADIESITSMRQLPINHLFIGPILWSASVDLPFWWKDLPEGRPIVFISLGSSGDASLLPIIIETLSHIDVTVICVTADNVTLTKSYDNVFIAAFLPSNEVVKKSDIVICNGGSPMVYQALVEKKVVIGIPSNLDQYLMMSFLNKAKKGIMIRSGDVNEGSLQQAMNKALKKIKCINSIPKGNVSLQLDRLEKIIQTAVNRQ